MTMEEAGKIIGYEYEVKNLATDQIITNLKRVDDINTSIKITTDGEYAITIKAIDEAGNRSANKTINVYKDTEKPEIGNISIIGEPGIYGFTVQARRKRQYIRNSKICMYNRRRRKRTDRKCRWSNRSNRIKSKDNIYKCIYKSI